MWSANASAAVSSTSKGDGVRTVPMSRSASTTSARSGTVHGSYGWPPSTSSKHSATQPPSSYVHSRRGTGAEAGSAATMRASRRCRPGASGFAAPLTACMNTRLPSWSRPCAASPGEKPVRWVIDSTTREPRRRSRAARTSAGRSFQSTRRPSAGGLEEDTSPELQVLVDAPLDRVADIVRESHDQVLVLGGARRKAGDLNRRMKLDPPLARQRDHPERAQPRPERRDREVRQAETARHRGPVAEHWEEPPP